jgi:hypothetical protein
MDLPGSLSPEEPARDGQTFVSFNRLSEPKEILIRFSTYQRM